MADKKISALTPSTTPLTGAEVLPIVQSGSTVKVSVANLTIGRDVASNSIATSLGAVSTPAYTFTGDTNTGIYSPTADTIAFVEGGVEAMRIDSSGNVGIGTTSPDAGLTVIKSATISSQVNVAARIGSGVTSDLLLGSVNGNTPFVASQGAYPVTFFTNAAERMRIDSSGTVRIGTSSGNVGYGGGSGFVVEQTGQVHSAVSGSTDCYYMQKDNTGGAYLKFFYGALNSAPSAVGDITTNGTGASYNTASDYRLKNIDGPIANSGAYIDALKPVQGSWKADGSRFIGLLAHEAQEVSETPIATGEKDGEKMQAMDYSAPELIANLIAEIQSLRARVAQLEGN